MQRRDEARRRRGAATFQLETFSNAIAKFFQIFRIEIEMSQMEWKKKKEKIVRMTMTKTETVATDNK